MIKKFRRNIFNKMAMSDRKHPVYILPTADGLKVLALNFLLLTIGLIYANNYVLLFNFILFCLCLSSMFYTHFNLNKLSLENFHLDPVFHNETSKLNIYFKTSGHGHYFLKARLFSDLVSIEENQSFKLDPESKSIQLNVKGLKRGKGKVHSVYLETVFPFNFFRCFIFFKVDYDICVYPERLALGLHKESEQPELFMNSDENFQLKEYLPGDSMRQMDWKRFAKTDEKYLRQHDNDRYPTLILSVNPSAAIENELKSLTHALYRCHNYQIRYGLKIGDKLKVNPEHSVSHLSHCLEQLACYEA